MLEFLVAKHLLMAHLAFRRDLSDDDMLLRFSRDVGSPEMLRMLFVLTAADMTAVGPATWTEWKAELLAEMFDRALQFLSGAPPKFYRPKPSRIRHIAAKVYSLLEPAQPQAAKKNARSESSAARNGFDASTGSEHQRPVRDELFDSLPLHYLTATAPEQIARDIVAIRQLSDDEPVIRGHYEPATGTTEYRVITRDTIGSGLFNKITGALAAKGLEILSANICTTTEGLVIDSFHVHDGDHGGPVPDFRLRARSRRAIANDVRSGRTTVEHLFQRHRRYLRTEPPHLFREPTRVVIDNDSSERFTIIDVFADDRRGLLYAIASNLLELGLSVSLAKIATHFDQVLDVFYVTDREGAKLQDVERLEEIRSRLAHPHRRRSKRPGLSVAARAGSKRVSGTGFLNLSCLMSRSIVKKRLPRLCGNSSGSCCQDRLVIVWRTAYRFGGGSSSGSLAIRPASSTRLILPSSLFSPGVSSAGAGMSESSASGPATPCDSLPGSNATSTSSSSSS